MKRIYQHFVLAVTLISILKNFIKKYTLNIFALTILVLALLLILPGCSKDENSTTDNTTDNTTTQNGIYSQSSGTVSKTGQTYYAEATDASAIKVTGGTFTLSNSMVSSSGNTSSSDNSSFYGLNAVILAYTSNGSSVINLSVNNIISTGKGANGVFAYGSASITMSGDTVTCTGQYAHAIMCSGGGTITANNVVLSTSGANSGAIATDRGSGTITVNGAKVNTSGADAPGIYSTGIITVSNATVKATGSEVAVIEGANSIILNNSNLTSTKDGKWGVLIFQSMSGDATGNNGYYTMNGGSLAYTSSTGPLFYVTNTTGNISLTGVNVTATSGVLIKAASGNWGTSGSNGGNAKLTASGQTLSGDIIADSYSTLNISLTNSSAFTGSINNPNTAKTTTIVLDATSTWTLTANSYINTFSATNGISGTSVTNITGNGYNIYYKSSANSSLGGLTYTLVNGGQLIPQ